MYNFFLNVVPDLKIPNTVIIFPKKTTHSLLTVIETFEKTPVFLILKKGKKDYSRGVIESYPGFKH